MTPKNILIVGASFAGLSTAYWMQRLGYDVTVVEAAKELKKGGTPVNIQNVTVPIVKRMGLFDRIKMNRIDMGGMEFKNADDTTAGSMWRHAGEQIDSDDCEIERDTMLGILFDAVKDNAEFVFDCGVTALADSDDSIAVSFEDGSQRSFDLVFGCDGNHSAVRRSWFGAEAEFSHFLEQYFSITIVDQLLIKENTAQMYNVPGKAVMLNAYNNKTDIILCFFSQHEIPYDYRNEAQQRAIILEQFAGQGWRTPELLEQVKRSSTFYFDKLCQIKMPSWTKGRVALVGDAGYCASPAAGMGGSLAIIGASALADAFQNHPDDFERAFEEYNTALHPFVEEVQANAVSFGLEIFVPRTEEAIRERNSRTAAF